MKNVHSFLLEGSNKFFGDGCILVYNFQAKMLWREKKFLNMFYNKY